MTSLSAGPVEFFSNDHRECDALWAKVEEAHNSGETDQALANWKAFVQAMTRHLAMEEEVLFPAFEEASGMGHGGPGPTMVMRAEHTQMRGVMEQMGEAAKEGDFDALLDHGDTLMMLIGQHNMKEESVLYPMASRVLGPEWESLSKKLESYL